MNTNYTNIYNNLIKLTTNKLLYKSLDKQDTFNDRLNLFLFHFAFFLKEFKKTENEKKLQEIYDFNFRQLELSIREIGYGDQSINKKMKDYLNLFHDMIDKFHFWEDLSEGKKEKILQNYIPNSENSTIILIYFENYLVSLKKNTLNSYIKSVSRT